jgi:hypothetical protein
MFTFGKKQQKTTPQNEPTGKAFLSQAQEEHEALFQGYIEMAEEFDDFPSFVESLHADAWKLTQKIAKASFKNGLDRGKQR